MPTDTPSSHRAGADAVLLQPPPGDLTGPYPALAYLKASAEREGHTVRTRDLGIEALWFLSEESKLSSLLNDAADMRERMEAKGWLDPAEQRQYLLLVSAMGLGLKPGLLTDALKVFKDESRFYNYRLYKRACHFLEAFYRLLTALHYPTQVTPSEYPSIRGFQSLEEVFEHRERALNPYIPYYEDLLFPQIQSLKPSIIGISMVFGSQSVQALVLGKLLKERFPQVHVTIGGAYFSQWVLLMDDARLRNLFACCDSIVCGEGEKAFADLLGRIMEKKPLDGVPNLIHPDPDTQAIHRFSSLEYADLESLQAPDYSDLDLSMYLAPEPIIPYCISRGCYWGRCAFCQNRYGENRMRRYQAVPVEKAIAEMSSLAERYGSNHFNFSNDAIDPVYVKKFSEAAIGSGKRFVWNTDLRAEKAFTPDLCNLMARAGLNCVAIGFESGCQRTLDAIDKGYRVDTMRDVFGSLYNAGVATQAMGIFGFPGEIEQDGEMTVRFLEENEDRISYYVMGLLMVLPGSRLYDHPDQYGISSISYEKNPLMAPEPVWKSDIRMSATAVNNLYSRLGRLEDIYAINDYPYVGGLSTNHGFLYFRKGPDILKRLRKEEKEYYGRLTRLFWSEDGRLSARKLKSIIPRLNFPITIYVSPFPIEQIIAANNDMPHNTARLVSMGKRDYLVDPVNMPFRIGPTQYKFLKRIDGERNVKAILDKLNLPSPVDMIPFLLHLLNSDLLDVTGTQIRK